jgi:hypothetical protein
MELNILLGSEHFYIYNFTGSRALDPYLLHYQSEGLLTLLPWNLPMSFNEDMYEIKNDFQIVWNYAQEVLIHDCLYRNLLTSQHLAYLDLDEFIIPQKVNTRTWSQMIDQITANNIHTIGSFHARNAMFDLRTPRLNRTDGHLYIRTMHHTQMHTSILEVNHRSKFIVRPEMVLYLMIHFVQTYWTPDIHTYVLPIDVGLLHHYRVWAKNRTHIQNTAAVKYNYKLRERMQMAYHDICVDAEGNAIGLHACS